MRAVVIGTGLALVSHAMADPGARMEKVMGKTFIPAVASPPRAGHMFLYPGAPVAAAGRASLENFPVSTRDKSITHLRRKVFKLEETSARMKAEFESVRFRMAIMAQALPVDALNWTNSVLGFECLGYGLCATFLFLTVYRFSIQGIDRVPVVNMNPSDGVELQSSAAISPFLILSSVGPRTAGVAMSDGNTSGGGGALGAPSSSPMVSSAVLPPNPQHLLRLARYAGLLKKTVRTGWVRRHVPKPESVAEHSYRMAMLAMFYAPHVSRSADPEIFKGDVKHDALDVTKCCKMSLVHDLAEGIVGDIVVAGSKDCRDNISRKEKAKLEEQAIRKILLGDSEGLVGVSRNFSPTNSSPRNSQQHGSPTKRKIDGTAAVTASEGESDCNPTDARGTAESQSADSSMRYELLRLWYEYEGQATPESRFVKDLDRLEMIIQADEYEEQTGTNLSDFYSSTKGTFVSQIAKAVDAELRSKRETREEQKKEAAIDSAVEAKS